jgi:hypothetical protein
MKIHPTPIHQLPSYLARVNEAKEVGPKKILPYIISGCLLAVALFVAFRLSANTQNNPKLISNNEHDRK